LLGRQGVNSGTGNPAPAVPAEPANPQGTETKNIKRTQKLCGVLKPACTSTP